MSSQREYWEYEAKMRQLDRPNEDIRRYNTPGYGSVEREINEKEREQAWGSWHREKKILPLLSHYIANNFLIKSIVFLSPPLALIVFVFISWGFIPAALLFYSFVFYIMR